VRFIQTIYKPALLTAVSLALIAGTASNAKAEDFTEAQKEALHEIIKEYLMENPEIIMNSVEAHRAKQMAEAAKRSQEKLTDFLDELTGSDAPSIGSKDADITVVEFFDYNCGYCKRAVPDIQAILETDKNVRFVFQEMPILSEASELAAKWALAAHKQGRYFDYHVALMNHRGNKDEAALVAVAEELELDVEQMKKDAASEDVEKAIQESRKISQEIGIRGTPAFIVNGELKRGYLGKDGIAKAIEKARENNG